MVPGGARSYKVVLGGIRWYQVVPCQVGPGCFEMVPGVRMMIRVVIRMMIRVVISVVIRMVVSVVIEVLFRMVIRMIIRVLIRMVMSVVIRMVIRVDGQGGDQG